MGNNMMKRISRTICNASCLSKGVFPPVGVLGSFSGAGLLTPALCFGGCGVVGRTQMQEQAGGKSNKASFNSRTTGERRAATRGVQKQEVQVATLCTGRTVQGASLGADSQLGDGSKKEEPKRREQGALSRQQEALRWEREQEPPS